MAKKEKKGNVKGIWLSLGTLKKGFPDQVLKLSKFLSKGTYVLAKLPEGRKEIFILTEVPYRIPFDIEGIPVVIKKATLKEIQEYEKKLEMEEKGKEFCLQFAKELGIEMIGASVSVIKKAEDRELFRNAMEKIGLKVPKSRIARNMEEARKAAEEIGYPLIIRPSFTLGGTGSGVVYNREELEAVARAGLDASMISEILIEESLTGAVHVPASFVEVVIT